MENVEQTKPNPIVKFFSDITTKKAILIISILGIIVFGNSLANGFVGDDASQLAANPDFQSITNVGAFFSGAILPNDIYYKPIFNTFNAFILTIFGPSSIAFHSFSILLHLVVLVFLFLVLSHFFNKPLSLVLALVFLVHPINSEVVYYISDLQDSLFMFFGLLGLYKLIKAKSTGSIILVTFLLFLSVLSKETGALFFPLAIIYSLVFNRKYLYQLIGLLGFAGLMYLALRMNAIGIYSYPALAPIADLTLAERLLHIPAILFFYIKTFFFPIDVSSSYNWVIKSITVANFYLPLLVSLIAISGVIFFGIKFYKRTNPSHFKHYIFFGLWLAIGLMLHLQVIPLDATVADRWFYLPMGGALGIVGTLFQAYNINFNHKYILTSTLIILTLLSARTIIRSFDWRNGLTLYTHDIEVSNSYVLYNALGSELFRLKRLDEARHYITKSIEIYPSFINYSNLGTVFAYEKDYIKAKESYLKALEFGDSSLVYENLSFLLIGMENDLNETNLFIQSALKKYPNNSLLWFSAAIMEYKLEDLVAAEYAIRRAYDLNHRPDIKQLYDVIKSGKLGVEFNILP